MGGECFKDEHQNQNSTTEQPLQVLPEDQQTPVHRNLKEVAQAQRISLDVGRKPFNRPVDLKFIETDVQTPLIREESQARLQPVRRGQHSPTSIAEVADFTMRKERRSKLTQLGSQSPTKLHADFKKRLNPEAQSDQEERKKISFDAVEYDLSAAFQKIDRDHDGKIGMFDLMRELKRDNPTWKRAELDKIQAFLDQVVSVYSSAEDHNWEYGDFLNFMHDAACLDRSPRRQKN